MTIKYIDKDHYLFGGKGDVWGETAHIAKLNSHTTLCGKPMLSTNHVALNNIQEPGCTLCMQAHGYSR